MRICVTRSSEVSDRAWDYVRVKVDPMIGYRFVSRFRTAIFGSLLVVGACAAPPARLVVNDRTPDRFAASGNFAACVVSASVVADYYETVDPTRTANARYDAAACAEASGDRETALLNYRLSQEADPSFYLARTAELRAGAPLKTADEVMAQARNHVTKRVQDQLDTATRVALAPDPLPAPSTPEPSTPEVVAEVPRPAPPVRAPQPVRTPRPPAEIVVSSVSSPSEGAACLRHDGMDIHNVCDRPLLASYCGVSSCVAAKDHDTSDHPAPGQRALLLPPGVTHTIGPVAWLVACPLSDFLRDGFCRHSTGIN